MLIFFNTFVSFVVIDIIYNFISVLNYSFISSLIHLLSTFWAVHVSKWNYNIDTSAKIFNYPYVTTVSIHQIILVGGCLSWREGYLTIILIFKFYKVIPFTNFILLNKRVFINFNYLLRLEFHTLSLLVFLTYALVE